MGSETKVGLLVGMCFIVCFAIILAHRGAPEPQREPQRFEISTAQPPAQQSKPASAQSQTQSQAQSPVDSPSPARETSKPVQEATRSPAGSGQPLRRTDQRNEPQTQLADGRSSERTAADGADRFTRRMAPVPGNSPNAQVGPRQGQPQDQTAQLQRALDEQAVAAHGDAPADSASAESGDGTRPWLDAGRRMADALASAGYQLSSRAQQQQVQRETAQNALVQEASGRETLTDLTGTGSTRLETPSVRDQNPASSLASTAPSAYKAYTIQPGDTLTRIARREYGSDRPDLVNAIFAANRDRMNSPDHLVLGKELRLPELAAKVNENAASALPSAELASARQGDTRPAEAGNSSPEAPSTQTADAMRQLQNDLGISGQSTTAASKPEGAGSAVASEHIGSVRHQVQPGDNLTRIVRRYYGTDDPATLKKVFEANRKHLRSPDALVVGMELDLPGASVAPRPADARPARDSALAQGRNAPDKPGETLPAALSTLTRKNPPKTTESPASAAKGSARPKSNGRERWYVVKAGDQLAAIAQEHLGSARRWREIAALNKDIMPDPARMRPGMRLRLPPDRTQTADARAARGASR